VKEEDESMAVYGRTVVEGGGDKWRRKVDDELKSDVGGREERNEFLILFSHSFFDSFFKGVPHGTL
jgi:hypothetical protein